MWGKKIFLLAVVVLTLTSITNADLILMLNGINAARESVQIKGKENLVIAIAGDANVDPNAYYIKATGGVLETIAEPNATCSQPQTCAYSFTFEDESSGGVISLIANNEMIIDGISVEGGDTIYKLVLFYIEETDTVVAFGINLEALSNVSSEPSEQNISETNIPQPEQETIALSAQETIADEDISVSDKAKDFNLPLSNYRQDKQEKRQKHLIHCSADSNSNIKTFSRAAYETGVKEHSQDIESIATDLQANNDGNIIEINSDITTNQVWTADNIYYVTSQIHVQALLVIEPGTVIMFSYDNYAAMFIDQGGTLISCGTPDKLIVYTSDYGYYGYGYYYDYFCPIYIDGSASTCTKVTYSYIEFAAVAIITNNMRLDTPLENNYLFHNGFGIGENGTHLTDIMNNLIFDTDYPCNSIEIEMASYFGEADANSYILIQNNTCDNQGFGIVVNGVPDINDAGLVVLINNIVSESHFCGIYFYFDCYVYAIVSNTGYYGNLPSDYGRNKNWDFPEYDPVEANDCPYVVGGPGELDIYYLDQNCPFIDAGWGYIDETPLVVGMTTDVNGTPDSNNIDIGFHYPNWDYSNAGDGNMLSADWNGDLQVDFKDFAIFANNWRQSISGGADLDGSGFVDYNDLSILAGQWLDIPPLGVTFDQDPNLVSGVLEVTLDSVYDDIGYYLLMDGQYLGSFYGGDIAIPTYEYCNGSHGLKIVGVSLDNEVLVGPSINITVNNRLYCLTGSEVYKYNQAYQFAGFYEPNDGSTLDLTIRDLDDNVIWTNSSSGTFNFVVPAGILQSPYNELTIQEAAGVESGYMGIEASESSEMESWVKNITKEFNVTDDPNCANARSLLVGVKKGFMGIGDWTYNRREVWKEYLNACKNKSLDPTICLFFGQATRTNIETAFGLPNVKSIMIITDGNRQVGNTHRTFFEAWDGPYFSYLGRNRIGENYEPLPPQFETGYSVEDLKPSFHWRNKMYVFIDACKNGTSCMDPGWFYSIGIPEPDDNNYSEEEYWRTADMAQAFDIGDPLEQKLYMSWRGEAFKGVPLNHYNDFLHTLWKDVGGNSPAKNRFDFAISDAATCESGNRIPAANFSCVGNTAIYFGE